MHKVAISGTLSSFENPGFLNEVNTDVHPLGKGPLIRVRDLLRRETAQKGLPSRARGEVKVNFILNEAGAIRILSTDARNQLLAKSLSRLIEGKPLALSGNYTNKEFQIRVRIKD